MSFYDELLDNTGTHNEEPLITGIVLGEVKENWDNDHPGMLKVEMLLGEEKKSVLGWIPVIAPYAGKEYGAYMLPEIGSQVAVTFYLGQPQSPYVIGCLWNQTTVLPPETANEKNTVKTVVTKGGNRIVLSDEEGKEKITLMTKGKLKLEFDDENQKIIVSDENAENALEMDAKNGAMTLCAKKKLACSIGGKEVFMIDGDAKKVSLKADQICLEAGQKLLLKGQNTSLEGSSTELKGQNVKIEAQASLALKGTASLKAESSGMTEIKGSMLKLN